MKLLLDSQWVHGSPNLGENDFPFFLAFTKDSGMFPQVCMCDSSFEGGFATVTIDSEGQTLSWLDPQKILAWCPIPRYAVKEEAA